MTKYSNFKDSDLAMLLGQGDVLAYTEIYDRYWGVLFSHAVRILRNEDDAMDVIQDVFESLWAKAPDIEFSISVKAYLYAATRNNTLNMINRSKIRDRYINSLGDFLEKGEYTTDEQVLFNEFLSRVDREVANLPQKMREIFVMSRMAGLSHKEIANELNITDNTVKKTINRAIKVLRAQISIFFTFFI